MSRTWHSLLSVRREHRRCVAARRRCHHHLPRPAQLLAAPLTRPRVPHARAFPSDQMTTQTLAPGLVPCCTHSPGCLGWLRSDQRTGARAVRLLLLWMCLSFAVLAPALFRGAPRSSSGPLPLLIMPLACWLVYGPSKSPHAPYHLPTTSDSIGTRSRRPPTPRRNSSPKPVKFTQRPLRSPAAAH